MRGSKCEGKNPDTECTEPSSEDGPQGHRENQTKGFDRINGICRISDLRFAQREEATISVEALKAVSRRAAEIAENIGKISNLSFTFTSKVLKAIPLTCPLPRERDFSEIGY